MLHNFRIWHWHSNALCPTLNSHLTSRSLHNGYFDFQCVFELSLWTSIYALPLTRTLLVYDVILWYRFCYSKRLDYLNWQRQAVIHYNPTRNHPYFVQPLPLWLKISYTYTVMRHLFTVSLGINWLGPVRHGSYFVSVVLKLMSWIDILSTSCKIGRIWVPAKPIDKMAWRRQATRSQLWIQNTYPKWIAYMLQARRTIWHIRKFHANVNLVIYPHVPSTFPLCSLQARVK